MTALQKKKKKPSSEKARTKAKSGSGFKKFLYKALLALNIILVFSMLMSYMAVHINPEDFALFAFFGLAYPYILLLNILMIITWIFLLKYEALISVALILLGLNHFSNYIQLFKQTGNRSGEFKVLSYNVHMFNYFEKERDSRSKIYNLIKKQSPDIFCLQEFYMTGNPAQVQSVINAATGIKYNAHVKVIGTGRNRYFGIATFSRFPIIRRGEIVHPGSSSLSTFTDIVIKKDTFRIYNNHLQSFRLKRMDRSFIEELTSDEKETIGEVRNLYSRLKIGFVRRALQAQVVKNHVRQSPYPVIVVGDFNDTPVSYAYRKIRKGLNDSFVNSGYGAGFTYKGNYPANRIDYILYDNSLINNYFEILKVKYSDHYPVVAYFKLKN